MIVNNRLSLSRLFAEIFCCYILQTPIKNDFFFNKQILCYLSLQMETLYTGHIHGFPPATNISYGYINAWATQGGLVALGVVLGSSVSLVGLAFAFITYR